jgi:hypothetical protein
MLTHPNPLADAATAEADDRPLVHLVQLVLMMISTMVLVLIIASYPPYRSD